MTCSPAPQHLRRYLNMSQRQGDGAKGCHAYDLSKWCQNKFKYPNETYHMFTDFHSLACPERELRDEKNCTRFDRVAGTLRTRKYTSNDHKKTYVLVLTYTTRDRPDRIAATLRICASTSSSSRTNSEHAKSSRKYTSKSKSKVPTHKDEHENLSSR